VEVVLKRKKFLIGGIILLLAVGYLGYTAFAGATVYYFTVVELVEQQSSISEKTIRVTGNVAPGSIEKESAGSVLRFNIVDPDSPESLPVYYKGVIPDTFTPDSEVVIEGYLGPGGIFHAQVLMAKCPTKYLPES